MFKMCIGCMPPKKQLDIFGYKFKVFYIYRIFIKKFVKKTNEMSAAKKMTNLQLELLKIFSFELPDSQLVEIKDMLSKYFANKASDEMDRLWESNNWSDETMDDWSNEHMRTDYE